MAVKSTTQKPRKSPSAKSSVKNKAQQPAPVTSVEHIAQKTEVTNGASAAPEHKIQEQIRVRAYELFEQRGRHAGSEHEDWVRAESEILLKYQREKSA